jgi:hypothetical protein
MNLNELDALKAKLDTSRLTHILNRVSIN